MKSLFELVVCGAPAALMCARFILSRQPALCNDALQAFSLLTQFRLLSCYLLLFAVKRRGRLARTPKHRDHRPVLAIQKKIAMATAPKRISGKLSASPICNHSENE